jgi:16S rRNA (uracil1498-N3)-methyltransferase
MSERFFISTPPVAGRAVLSGDEARHLVRVLRAKVGDSVTLFDGRGTAWPARVVAISRNDVDLATAAPLAIADRCGPLLTLAVALPKGERQKWLIEKLTELGTGKLVPLVTERGVAQPTDSAIERLARGVIEACKQCGRNTLLEIDEPMTVAEVVAARPVGAVGLVADPCGGPLDAASWRTAAEVIGLVGPEGGFTDGELAQTDAAGWKRVAFASHVLRVETAAMALAAAHAACAHAPERPARAG